MGKDGKVISFAEAKARRQTNPESTPTAEPANFGHFMKALNDGSEENAAKVLAEIFAVPLENAQKCTRHFIEQVKRDPNTLMRGMTLRNAIEENKGVEAMELIELCFGLVGIDAVNAISRLKK